MAKHKKKGRKSSLQGRDVRKEISAKQYIRVSIGTAQAARRAVATAK